MKIPHRVLIITFLYLFVALDQAQAYLDPGTGSYLLQIALATLLGGAYIFKGYLGKAKDHLSSFFSKLLGGKKDDKKEK